MKASLLFFLSFYFCLSLMALTASAPKKQIRIMSVQSRVIQVQKYSIFIKISIMSMMIVVEVPGSALIPRYSTKV